MKCGIEQSRNKSLKLFVAVILLLTADLCVGKRINVLAAGSISEPSTLQWRKEFFLVPAAIPNVNMNTWVLFPPGPGPYRLAVIVHGTTESEELRRNYPEPVFEVLSSWLLNHNYAVALPQRPGHGDTGGSYLESAGGCEDAQYEDAGYATGESIQAVIDYFLSQPFVKHQSVLLVGHSAGAWGALALASRTSKGPVGGVINFAGGRGGRSYGVANRNCAPDRLIRAATTYGRTTRVPTLWLYAENDSFFAPDLSQRMADAFGAAGGPVDYRLLPPIGEEGHGLIYFPDAVRYWGPIVEKFLGKLASHK